MDTIVLYIHHNGVMLFLKEHFFHLKYFYQYIFEYYFYSILKEQKLKEYLMKIGVHDIDNAPSER